MQGRLRAALLFSARLLASQLAGIGQSPAEAAIATLIGEAIDLGAKGLEHRGQCTREPLGCRCIGAAR